MSMRAGYVGKARHWHGAIAIGPSVVWRCPHSHNNREQTTMRNGVSARACADGQVISIVTAICQFVAYARAAAAREL
jgi:hypothetical protein